MFRRRKNESIPAISSFCYEQVGGAVVALNKNGPIYIVSVGPDFDPYYGFPVDTIVDAYRTFLLVVNLIKVNQLHNDADVVRSHLAFREEPNARLRAHLGDTYNQIRSMPLGDMPSTIQEEYRLHASGGGR
jgi:hypothetical protein